MDETEIKNKFNIIENEIIELRKKQHDLSNKIQPIALIHGFDNEINRLRDDVHDLVPDVASMQVYVERIPEFNEKFGNLFKTINKIEKIVIRNEVKLYFIIACASGVCSLISAYVVKVFS